MKNLKIGLGDVPRLTIAWNDLFDNTSLLDFAHKTKKKWSLNIGYQPDYVVILVINF